MQRTANFQPLAWFWDFYQRGLLDLEPKYQRRSVWNQEYRDFFVDTVLNDYPAPAIFLHQEITPEGRSIYSVVDGKQRLTTLFDFASDYFPVSETCTIRDIRGKYFKDLSDDTKRKFWMYQFSVEYLPSTEEEIINNIFDRINRNVAKLTPQELRHARFDGIFITEAERLSEWMTKNLPNNFPAIVAKSRSQMKDVEMVAQLLLFLEEDVKSYSQDDLDKAFAERDVEWELKDEIIEKFYFTIEFLKAICSDPEIGQTFSRSRLKNQADFYSLFAAISEGFGNNELLNPKEVGKKLLSFIQRVEDESIRSKDEVAKRYFEATRSASNDPKPRRTRIEIIRGIILNQEGGQ
ncbi:DUF262 domain-containing protein [Neobacillus sp. SAB-20_R2A]|uniref:DUF262 domain-containing protein n=1 Tax=Neobacillus sp. SAB-20_R2A TaxID=3120519 RepID=UPI003C6E3FD8